MWVLHSNPAAAEFYDNEVQKSFPDHSERSKVAKKAVLRHLGLQAVPTLPTPAASPMAQRGGAHGGGGGVSEENVFAKKGQHRPSPLKLPNGSADDVLQYAPLPPQYSQFKRRIDLLSQTMLNFRARMHAIIAVPLNLLRHSISDSSFVLSRIFFFLCCFAQVECTTSLKVTVGRRLDGA